MKVDIKGYRCFRCGHEWLPRADNPKVCPMCKSPWWNVQRYKIKSK